MKTKLIIATGVLVAIAATFSASSAQTPAESPVKLMPTNEKGIVKLMYTLPASDDIQVSFFTDEKTFHTDKIKGNDFPQGFSRRYDLRNIKAKSFWIEVRTPQLTATYRLVPSEDGKSYKAVSESTTYFHSLVADNN